MIHTCAECGLIHDHAQPPAESAEVAIARIQAEASIKTAEIAARAERHVADVQSDSDVQVAEASAGAVEAALAVAVADDQEPDAEDGEDPGAPAEALPPPVVIAQDIAQDDAPEPPRHEEHEQHETPPAKRGFGAW